MKKVLLFAIPASLFLTLAIAKFAYAWYVGASATCYNSASNNITVASSAASASGLENNLARVKAHVNGVGYPDEMGPSEGPVSAMALQVGPLGTRAKAYAYAEGYLRHNAGQHDEWLELKTADDDEGLN